MDDRFFTAYFPGHARICGRDLTDYTPYHYLLLKAIDSPFLRMDGIIRPADLLAAVAACRNRFGLPVKIRPGWKDIFWKIRMTRNPKLFRKQAGRFSLWLESHSSSPRFWEIVSGGPKTRDFTGPQILTLIVPLFMKTSMSEEYVWNMSIGRVQWLNSVIQEIEGSDRRFLFDSDLTEDFPDNA